MTNEGAQKKMLCSRVDAFLRKDGQYREDALEVLTSVMGGVIADSIQTWVEDKLRAAPVEPERVSQALIEDYVSRVSWGLVMSVQGRFAAEKMEEIDQ